MNKTTVLAKHIKREYSEKAKKDKELLRAFCPKGAGIRYTGKQKSLFEFTFNPES